MKSASIVVSFVVAGAAFLAGSVDEGLTRRLQGKAASATPFFVIFSRVNANNRTAPCQWSRDICRI
jgi:hypothetical protein